MGVTKYVQRIWNDVILGNLGTNGVEPSGSNIKALVKFLCLSNIIALALLNYYVYSNISSCRL